MTLNDKYAGLKYGKLTILKAYRENGETMCDCGNFTKSYVYKVTHGKVSSCGCMRGVKHKGHGTRLYRIWLAMKNRCRNPNMANYKYYGGKGISYCPEWEHFVNFRDWAEKNGYNNSLSIDRIDSSGNYEPSNCRWVTPQEQSNNLSSNVIITHCNTKYSLKQFCRKFNLSYPALQTALNRGRITPEEISKKIPSC